MGIIKKWSTLGPTPVYSTCIVNSNKLLLVVTLQRYLVLYLAVTFLLCATLCVTGTCSGSYLNSYLLKIDSLLKRLALYFENIYVELVRMRDTMLISNEDQISYCVWCFSYLIQDHMFHSYS